MHYVIVLLFLQHFHKEARKQLAGRSNFLKHSIGHFAILDLTFCICVVTLKSPHISLFFQQSLRKIPVNRTPCIPFSPHSPEFSPLSKQNHFSLIFVHYPFPKISFPSENLCRWPNLWLGTECSRSCPVLNLPMDCKDQGLRLVFLFLLVRVRVLFFFYFELNPLYLKKLKLWDVMHVGRELIP